MVPTLNKLRGKEVKESLSNQFESMLVSINSNKKETKEKIKEDEKLLKEINKISKKIN
jgi:hypothetical protein